MHDGFDVVCDQPEFEPSWRHSMWVPAAPVTDNLWDQQITVMISEPLNHFDQWKRDLEFDLAYYLDQPRTAENVENIQGLVDWYFSDVLFQQVDHKVTVSCDLDGVAINVCMKYDDPIEFYEDFGVDADEINLLDLTMLDGVDRVAVLGVDFSKIGDADLIEDAVWAVARQVAGKMGLEVLKAVDETKAEIAKTETDENSLLRKSADDILFAPIVTKEPEKPPIPSGDLEAGTWDYCD